MRPCLALALAVLVTQGLAPPALANDGFGGLTATGLTFGQTDAVAMESEDLFIGIDRITVDYTFRNITGADVTGEVIFPLPPIHVGYVLESQWNLPENMDRPNLVNLTATVDGQPVTLTIDRIAVIEPPYDASRPLSAQYDTPGRDVTADLARLGLPLSFNPDRVIAAMDGLTDAQREEAVALGLADLAPGYFYPNWSIVLRYHWTQTFPAGQVTRISHAYENRSGGGIFGWSHPPEDYQRDLVDQYCIDDSTSRGLVRALEQRPTEGDPYSMGLSWNIAYVLRTANSWAGPIGRFRLTIDKGAPDNIVSLCAEGLRKTGPTTFVLERTGYVPDRDLEILVAVPMRN